MKTRILKSIQQHRFNCLNGNDVITAKVSDHHPMVHDGVLLWNVMMQGAMRKSGSGVNNGFGMIESESQYKKRISNMAAVIVEIMMFNPEIRQINLCEGPIKKNHVDHFLRLLKKYPVMARFFLEDLDETISDSINYLNYDNQGIILISDKADRVKPIYPEVEGYTKLFRKLANRLQLWQISQGTEIKYLAVAHFPFAGDELKSEKNNLSNEGKDYCELINHILHKYKNEKLIFCADFNLNPYLISEINDRAMDCIANHNSILLLTNSQLKSSYIKTVTVDGILLSTLEKQKYNSNRHNLGLFRRLKNEYSFMQKDEEKNIVAKKY